MNCNASNSLIPLVGIPVSIPNRDFDELQFFGHICILIQFLVSIPNRDFDELQLFTNSPNW